MITVISLLCVVQRLTASSGILQSGLIYNSIIYSGLFIDALLFCENPIPAITGKLNIIENNFVTI